MGFNANFGSFRQIGNLERAMEEVNSTLFSGHSGYITVSVSPYAIFFYPQVLRDLSIEDKERSRNTRATQSLLYEHAGLVYRAVMTGM